MNYNNQQAGEENKVTLWLKDIFYSEVKPELEALSKEIKAGKRRVTLIGVSILVGSIIFGTLAVLYFGWSIDEALAVALAGVTGAFVLMAILYTQHIVRIKMHERVRRSAIQPIFKKFFSGLHYEPKKGISREEVQRFGVFKQFKQFKSGDRITGKVEGHAVVMSEVGMMWDKAFSKHVDHASGVIMVADSGLSNDVAVFVYPNKTKMHISRLEEKVDLESNEFEKRFDVRGNQHQSREIITPWYMAELLKLSNQAANGEVFVIFKNGKIFLFLSTENNLFKTGIFGKPFKYDLLKQYVKDAMLFYEILQLVHVSSHVKNAAGHRISGERFEQHIAAENK